MPTEIVIATWTDSEDRAVGYLKDFTKVMDPEQYGIQTASAIGHDEEGKYHVKHYEKHDAGGTFGALAGGVIGVFGGPVGIVAGATVGGVAGRAVAHRLSDYVSKDLEKEIENGLANGSSALIFYIDPEQTDHLIAELNTLGATVVHEPLKKDPDGAGDSAEAS